MLYSLKGYYLLSKSFACGSTVPIELLTEAPGSWEGIDCKIIPNALYEEEVDNILIPWCMEVKSKCADLSGGKNNKKNFK